MNRDIDNSILDDDLFDDEGSGGAGIVQNPIAQQGNGGVMNNGLPGQGNQPDNNQGNQGNQGNRGPAGQADDKDIYNRLNSLLGGGPIDGDNGGEGDEGGGNGNNAFKLNDDDSAIDAILKQNGIDPQHVILNGENGEVDDMPFSQLSREEQIDILQSIFASSEGNGEEGNDLTDDEADLINNIRRSRLSTAEFVNELRKQAVSEYIQSGAGTSEIDSLSDDDIYVSDYKMKVPDATDDECVEALNAAKQNPTVFKRMVDGMRASYKQQEDTIRKQQIEKDQQDEREKMQNLENLIIDVANKNELIKLGDLTFKMSNDDKENVASFILDSDVTGKRYLATALNDPETLYKMAWWVTVGEDVVDQMEKHYKQELVNSRAAAYKKGFEDAKNGKDMSYVVKGTNKRRGGVRSIPTLADIDNDDF